jgi:Tat protein translocase TatB subunit
MGSLGFPELILIFIVALIVFGPRRLPEIGQTLGKALREFRKATDELKNTLEREVRSDEFKQVTSPTVSRTEPVIDVAAETTPALEPSPAPLPAPHPDTTPEPPAAT